MLFQPSCRRKVGSSRTCCTMQYCKKPIRPGRLTSQSCAGQELLQVVVAQGRILHVDLAHHAHLDLGHAGARAWWQNPRRCLRHGAASCRGRSSPCPGGCCRRYAPATSGSWPSRRSRLDSHRARSGCAGPPACRRRTRRPAAGGSAAGSSWKPLSFSRPEKFRLATGTWPIARLAPGPCAAGGCSWRPGSRRRSG